MVPDKPGLVWHSNAPWTPTGYAVQTALFTPKLAEHYELALSSYYGLEGDWVPWQGIPVAPGLGGNTLGDEVICDHVRKFFGGLRDGLVVTLMDVWPLRTDVWRKLNVAAWCPVDHDPVPPNVVRFFEETGAVPIAMSRFGEERLPDALYVPHAVDTSVYKSVENARSKTQLPEDAFVVGIVAANKGNPSRKCFAEQMQAFAAFRARHDDALLYMHTEMLGRINGVNLVHVVRALGLADCVKFCDQYRIQHMPIRPPDMAATYSSFDVLMNCSRGEGFGIPILEAAACGVPSIVTDFSAMPEVAGEAGWWVSYRPEWVGRDDLAGPSWQALPDIEDMVESLEQAYQLQGARKDARAKQARQHAMDYDVETVFTDRLLPALDEARERFSDREPVAVAA